ncbi:uncharacterized protein EI90DRAFT_2904731, partial [Cantharellus anzutake]|uniref:uncharacterized protein n=1 Tax=Cantharellus anzutake TaxID=1750568 RepID=UPI001903C837
TGCSDVIKKPALQKHYARCHASVSCLDCSQTFQGPREFMSHVRCISEAEKYQGALYKGRKHSVSCCRFVSVPDITDVPSSRTHLRVKMIIEVAGISMRNLEVGVMERGYFKVASPAAPTPNLLNQRRSLM